MESKEEKPNVTEKHIVTAPDPLDIKLHEAMVENINLIRELKNLSEITIWIRLFVMFAIVIMVLMLLKAYRVV